MIQHRSDGCWSTSIRIDEYLVSIMVVWALGPILVYANVAKKPCSDTDHLCRSLTLGTRVPQSCGSIALPSDFWYGWARVHVGGI